MFQTAGNARVGVGSIHHESFHGIGLRKGGSNAAASAANVLLLLVPMPNGEGHASHAVLAGAGKHVTASAPRFVDVSAQPQNRWTAFHAFHALA